MKRIMIIGSCGAGKSTLAHKVQEKTGLELLHLDQHYWQPGWVEPTKEDWEAKVRQLVAKDSWIIDGNYSGSMHLRIPRADTILFLDYPRSVCLSRVIKRWRKFRGKTRPDLAVGCPERFDLSFLAYVFHFPENHRPRVIQKLEEFGKDKKIYIFKNDHQANKFLNQLP